MFKNTGSQKITVYAVDVSTGLPKSGDAANITVYVSKDNGTVTVLGDTSATETDATNAKGDYLFDLTQAETNADKLRFSGKSTTTNIVIVPQTIYTRPAAFGLVPGAADGLLISGTNAGTTTLGALTVTSGITADLTGNVSGSVGDLLKVNGSAAAAAAIALLYGGFEKGTAQGGGASTITLRSGASSLNDFYKDQVIFTTGGTGAGQTNRMSSYVGATRVGTVETAWVTQPDSTTTYVLLGRVG